SHRELLHGVHRDPEKDIDHGGSQQRHRDLAQGAKPRSTGYLRSFFQLSVDLKQRGRGRARAKGEIAGRHSQRNNPERAIDGYRKTNIDKNERQTDDDAGYTLGYKRHGGKIACERSRFSSTPHDK